MVELSLEEVMELKSNRKLPPWLPGLGCSVPAGSRAGAGRALSQGPGRKGSS